MTDSRRPDGIPRSDAGGAVGAQLWRAASEVAEHLRQADARDARIAALTYEYGEYVKREHAICRGCPVVRSGVPIVRSMLQWKATEGDGRLEHWTRRDIRQYLLGYLPTANLGRALIADAPTCAKDLVYFLADRGVLAGDDMSVLAVATDDVLDAYAPPAAPLNHGSRAQAVERRRAKRKAARSARKRNHRP